MAKGTGKMTGSCRKIIAVIGDAKVPSGSEKYELARELGCRLIDEGYRVMTGGIAGVMEGVSKGARESENYTCGSIIGILPGFDPETANPYVDTPIACGLDIARNTIIVNSDAVIAIGGGAGTLSEIAFAWQLYRLIIGYRIDGWSGKLADTRIDWRIRYPDIPDDRVYGVDGTDEAIEHLNRLLPLYNIRHKRIP